MSEFNVDKPFLKWVGGKTQILPHILNKFPREIKNYHEIFLGGGSVLLGLLSLEEQKRIRIKGKIYAYEVNESLIYVYKHIQSNADELYKYIQIYENEYNSIENVSVNRKPETIEQGKTSKESYYYWIRNIYNTGTKQSVESSALFLFLNRTCFRGLYREGPNGYNVPYGNYKQKLVIIKKDHLYRISSLIKNVEFLHSDFRDSFKNIKRGDFVYMDPPYAPESPLSFVKYVGNGFDLDTHNVLFEHIKGLGKTKFILSNANVPLVTDIFKDYRCELINAKRAINSKNPSATTTELIIQNF